MVTPDTKLHHQCPAIQFTSYYLLYTVLVALGVTHLMSKLPCGISDISLRRLTTITSE